MAQNDELIKIILSVGGQDAIDSLTKQVEQNRTAMEDLVRKWQDGSVATDTFTKESAKLARQEQELASLLNQVTEAQNAQAGSAAKSTTVIGGLKSSISALEAELVELRTQTKAGTISLDEFASRSNQIQNSIGSQKSLLRGLGEEGAFSANKILQLGNTFDDLQYVGQMGLRPIINNIMQIAPLAGMALIALESLRRMFGEQIVDAMGLHDKAIETSKQKIDSLQKKIEELEKKPYKLMVDHTELDKAKKELDDLEKREANRKAAAESSPEKTMKDMATKIATDYAGGNPGLVQSLSDIEYADKRDHSTSAQRKERDELRSRVANPTYDEYGRPIMGGQNDVDRLKALEKEIKDQTKEWVQKKLVDPFLAGDEWAINNMKTAAEKRPEAFARKGMDGLTAADAIGMMPSTVEEHVQRQDDQERYKANAEAAQEEAKKNVANEDYIQGLWDQQQAKEKKDREDGEHQAAALAQKKADEAEAKRKQSLLQSKAKIDQGKTAKAAEAEKQAKDRMGYERDVRQSFGDVAQANPGISPEAATRIAQEAVSLHRNFGIPLAQAQLEATQALMQGFSAVQMEYMRLRQQQALIQQSQRRMRTNGNPTQPLPAFQ